MNRRQKIIISVTGIFIVALIIVGLTYAYFLTQITGNTKDKSISVTTANLVVRYEDGTNIILDENTKLIPSSNAIGTKTFDVVNEGDEADYVVIVDNISIKNATTGESTTFKTNDFVYTLECTSSDGNDCSDVKTQSTLPLKNESILIGNRMKSGVTHSYTLTLWYLDSGENQSDDMNKTLDVRVNIEDIRRLENPYKDNTNSLAYNIIDNSLNKKNRTELMGYPLTIPAEFISSNYSGSGYSYAPRLDRSYYADNYSDLNKCIYQSDCSKATEYTTCTEEVIGKYIYIGNSDDYYGPIKACNSDGRAMAGSAESVLSITQDNYGISYYYRGNVEDNYVNFAGMCWRIVRIDGKGDIKLILEDKNTTCNNASFTGDWVIGSGNYGYEMFNETVYKVNFLEPKTNADKSMVKAFYDYQNTLNTKISTTYPGKGLSDYLISGNWCMNDTAYGTEKTPLTNDEINSRYLSMASFDYDAYIRLVTGAKKEATLKCNGNTVNEFKTVTVDNNVITTKSDMYVGTLTADEITYAGGRWGKYNFNYYLFHDYHLKYSDIWFLLTPEAFYGGKSMIFTVGRSKILDNDEHSTEDFRPSILLSSNVEIVTGGNGTKNHPYVIK